MQCPEPDRIAAYLEDKLFEEDRRLLEEHFAACEDCWQVFSNAVEYIAQRRPGQAAGAAPPDERPVKRGTWAQRNKLTSVAALLALSLGGSWLVAEGRRQTGETGVEQIAAGEVANRPILPRLTGEVWGRRPASGDAFRGASSTAAYQPGRWRYAKMVEEAWVAAELRADLPQLRTLGKANLLAGSTEEAVTALQRALAEAPNDSRTLNDLAAAYLARGLAADNADDVVQALETVSSALASDPELPAARFNLALALEELPLPDEAVRAWQAYLDVDQRSAWAAEARERLRELENRPSQAPPAALLRERIAAAARNSGGLADLVREHRQDAREAFVLVLLPAWARATLSGDAVAASAELDAARRLAAIWRQQTSDRSLERQIAEITQPGAAADSFARGHQALARGIEALEEVQIGQARPLLAAARRELPDDSAAAAWADTYLVACDFYLQGAVPAVARRLDPVFAQANEDAPLRAHVGWLRGLFHFRQAERQAIEQFGDALEEFETVGEVDHTAWMHFLLGDAHALFGDLPGAWFHRREVLKALPLLTHRSRHFSLLLAPAISTGYLEGRPRVANLLLEALARQGDSWTPRQQAELEVWRARVAMTLGDRRAAQEHWRAGTARLPQVEDPVIRRTVAGDLQAAFGSIADSPAEAVAALGKSIERARGAPDFRLPRLLLDRARAYRQLGNTEQAAADLREGIGWLLRQPIDHSQRGLLSARLAGGDALFDELVELELVRGNGDQALAIAEAGRSWGLAKAGVPLRRNSAAQSAGALPSFHAADWDLGPGTTVLYYSVLEKAVVLWRVDAAGVAMTQLAVKPSELTAWAGQLQTDLAAGFWTANTRTAASDLYTALIAPAGLDRQVLQLVIIADGRLDQLPFAALVNPSTNRYLIEERAIELAPNAASYVASRARARDLGPGQPSVLALGGPLPEGDLYPELPVLPKAVDEAVSVSRLYPRRRLLTRKDATREALLAGAGEFRVVHYAGHAVLNPVDPSRSSLALARDSRSDRSGALFASEVAPLRFDRTRLVVLAGCGTGSGPQSAHGGTLSLARAFLAAEVPGVVASLWPVRDGSTVALMTGLHRGIAAGQDPAVALRAAQLALLRGSDPALRSPSVWAAFGVLGS